MENRLVQLCINSACDSKDGVEKWRRQKRSLKRLPSHLADALLRRLHARRLLYPSLLECLQGLRPGAGVHSFFSEASGSSMVVQMDAPIDNTWPMMPSRSPSFPASEREAAEKCEKLKKESKANMNGPNMYIYRTIIDVCGLCGDYKKSRNVYQVRPGA